MVSPGKRVCAYCNNEKAWNWNGRKLKDGSRIHVDDSGARWAGRRCPDCERSRVYAAVRCDSFDREIIVRQLEEKGFTVNTRTLPLTAEKDGRVWKVDVRRAWAHEGGIMVESPAEPGRDIVALIFQSVRLVTPEQLNKIATSWQSEQAASSGTSSSTNESPMPSTPSPASFTEASTTLS